MSYKTIVILVQNNEEEIDYDDRWNMVYDDYEINVVPFDNGEKIRGYRADTVLYPEDIDQDIVNRIIRPMVAIGDGEMVEY
jgi:hypothetical protein